MSLVAELVAGVIEGIGRVLNRPPVVAPTWRWGHAFLPDGDNRCVYCGLFIPGRVGGKCVGPNHKLSPEELGR